MPDNETETVTLTVQQLDALARAMNTNHDAEAVRSFIPKPKPRHVKAQSVGDFLDWCARQKIATLAGMGGARDRFDEWASK